MHAGRMYEAFIHATASWPSRFSRLMIFVSSWRKPPNFPSDPILAPTIGVFCSWYSSHLSCNTAVLCLSSFGSPLACVPFNIHCKVWDKDVLGSNTHVAGCRFPMSAAVLSSGSSAHVPTPQWCQVNPYKVSHPGSGRVQPCVFLVKCAIAWALSLACSLALSLLTVVSMGRDKSVETGFEV